MGFTPVDGEPYIPYYIVRVDIYCTAVAIELQLQQAGMSGSVGSSERGWRDQELQSRTGASATALRGLMRLSRRRHLMQQTHKSVSGRIRSTSGDQTKNAPDWNRQCGFDSLSSGAVACQFLWDSEQQMLVVCHTGEVGAVLAYPAREQPDDEPELQLPIARELTPFTAAAVAKEKKSQHQQSSKSAQKAQCKAFSLSPMYECALLTREHSTMDRDERRRVQGAGKPAQSSFTNIRLQLSS